MPVSPVGPPINAEKPMRHVLRERPGRTPMPTTEAGKWLLDAATYTEGPGKEALVEHIDAIEAEAMGIAYHESVEATTARAVAPYRDALVELVEAAAGPDHQQSRGWCRLQAAIARAREVLANA